MGRKLRREPLTDLCIFVRQPAEGTMHIRPACGAAAPAGCAGGPARGKPCPWRATGGCPAGRPTRPTQMVRPSRAEPVLRVFATVFSAGRARSSPRCHGVITPLGCPASADPESAARSESASATPARRHETTAAGLRPEATVTGRPPRQRSSDRAGSGTRQRSGSIRVDPSPAPARAAERRAPAGRGARA